MDIRRIGAIKDRDEVIGNQTRVKVVKNKVAPPFRVIEFDILYGEGISKPGELIDLGVKAGVVEKSGSWYSYGPQRIGQGKENARSFLAENPDIADEIETKIRSDAGLIDIEALTQDEAKNGRGPRRSAGRAARRRSRRRLKAFAVRFSEPGAVTRRAFWFSFMELVAARQGRYNQ